MAPPFSGDDPDDEDRPPRRSPQPSSPWSTTTRGRRRDIDSDPLSRSYADNVLTAHPELLLPDSQASKKKKDSNSNKTEDGKNDDSIEDKYKFVNRYEQQRNTNKVTFEVPFVFSTTSSTDTSDQEAIEDSTTTSSSPTLKLSEDARLTMFSHVPPSTPDGRWTASISGNSKVHQVIGSTNASAEISYKASGQTRLIGGVDMLSTAVSSSKNNAIHNSRPLQLRFGAQYCESNNKQSPSSSPSMMQVTVRQCGSHKNSWGIAVATRDVMDPWIVTSNFWWHPLTRQWKTILNFSSMTTHILRLGIGWGTTTTSSNVINNAAPWVLPLSLFQLSVDPKLSTHRRLPVSIQYHPTNGAWNANATMLTTQPPPSSSTKNGSTNNNNNKTTSWRVGIHRASPSSSSSLAARWTIIVAWQRGDITLRIPILILGTATMAASSSSAESNNRDQQGSLLVATATPFLVCAIVGVAHEMISRLVWGDDMLFFNKNNTKAEPPESATTTATPNRNTTATSAVQVKAKQDALSQQNLMKRQAEARNATEQEKNGLVIESAIYQLPDNNQTDSHDTTTATNSDTYLDVTIPLQFWVTESTLTLAAGSKQHLLGFYPLTSTKGTVEASPSSSATEKPSSDRSTLPWWKEYWTPTKNRRSQIQSRGENSGADNNPSPTLTVHYSYQGVSFETTIGDDQALSLPGNDGGSNQ